MAKTALNTGYALYSNIVFAAGFDEASGNVIDLVTGAAIGVIQPNSTRGTDPTYGATIVSDGTANVNGVNFGDPVGVDGHAQTSIFVWQKSNIASHSVNRSIMKKTGGGNDSFSGTWQSSENLSFAIMVGGTGLGNSITDGLSTGSGKVDPRNWHAVGVTYDGAEGITRADNTKGTPEAGTGTQNATSHDFILHEDWDGEVALVLIFDVGLTDAQWADLVADPLQVFATPGGTVKTVSLTSQAPVVDTPHLLARDFFTPLVSPTTVTDATKATKLRGTVYRALTDVMDLTGSVRCTRKRLRAEIDALDLATMLAGGVWRSTGVGDTLPIIDSITADLARLLLVVVGDEATIDDTLLKTLALVRQATDTLALDPYLTAVVVRLTLRTLADGVAADDLTKTTAHYIKQLATEAALTDLIGTASESVIVRALADSAGVGEEVIYARLAVHRLTSAAGVADSLGTTALRLVVRMLTDQTALTTTLNTLRGVYRDLGVDALGVLDHLEAAFGRISGRQFIEVAAVADVVDLVRLLTKAVSDAFLTADNTQNVDTITRLLGDGVALEEWLQSPDIGRVVVAALLDAIDQPTTELTRQTRVVKAALSTAVLFEALAPVRSSQKRLAETLLMSDTIDAQRVVFVMVALGIIEADAEALAVLASAIGLGVESGVRRV